jgi:hypothetical protein
MELTEPVPEDVMTQPTDRHAILRLLEKVNTARGLRVRLRGMQGGAPILENATGRAAAVLSSDRPARLG